MLKIYEEVTEPASFEGLVESNERTRLISRKRNKVTIDPSRDYIGEAVQKYYHFYDWLLEKSNENMITRRMACNLAKVLWIRSL